jgi:hypothetical protein
MAYLVISPFDGDVLSFEISLISLWISNGDVLFEGRCSNWGRDRRVEGGY